MTVGFLLSHRKFSTCLLQDATAEEEGEFDEEEEAEAEEAE